MEKETGMSSKDFYRQFQEGKLGDDIKLIKWAGEYETLERLEYDYRSLSGSRILWKRSRRSACCHSQQCVEKALKALILEAGRKPERTHDIVELFQEAKKLDYDTGLSLDEAVFLNSIYKGRYPAEQGLLPRSEPESEDAGKAIASARTLIMKTKAAGGWMES